MPKAISSSLTACRACTVATILSLSKIIPSLYSCYLKEGLVYVALANPFLRQPSSCLEYTKANIYLSCDVRSTFNTKYTRPITLNSRLVP